jgi:hypothetical protein
MSTYIELRIVSNGEGFCRYQRSRPGLTVMSGHWGPRDLAAYCGRLTKSATAQAWLSGLYCHRVGACLVT